MEELIRKAQSGDKEAFTLLFMQISDELYKITKSRISNEDDINDVIQDTMLETYKSIKKLKNEKAFKKWVITILINKCNRVFRKKYKNDISYDEYDIENFSSVTNLNSDIEFYDLLSDLKYEERIIVILYYMQEYSVKEIREIIHLNENTIYSHLYRARQKIKTKLEGGSCNG